MMKEKLYTIPLTEAFRAGEECPFCYIERELEKDALEFTLGASASYMESDIREQTDEKGFCKEHFKKMYQYGNSLGNALILKTHFKKINQELEARLKAYQPEKRGMFGKLKKEEAGIKQISYFVAQKEETCFVCDYIKDNYDRYVDTFFHLFKNTPEFKDLIQNSKGFCFHHFGELTSHSADKLNDSQLEEYTKIVFPIMIEQMKRVEEDIEWLVDKYDYRNAQADWKNSRDALQRGMQKIASGYPAEKPYEGKK